MLEVNQLSRQYGNFKAVDAVSFTIGKGEIVGLLGHNGAGKTTIMKMISGFLEPNQGSIVIDDVPLADDPKRVQVDIGYLPENLPIYPEMIVADYLDYCADLKHIKKSDKIAEIRRVVAATDIASKLLAPISTLSRGFKQRLGVAQAILGAPKLLILDEPTNGLDPEQTQHMRDLIRAIAQQATVILSTHIMQEVDALCSRVLILRAGTLAVDAELEALRRTNHLLIETSMPANEVASLQSIAGVTAIEPVGEQYRVTLEKNTDARQVRATLARTVVDKGFELYQLQSEHRDLETLFTEVNEQRYQQENVSDAA